MFTERQQSLIDKCKATGYGWRKFALSVEAQGSCSPAQEEALVKMWQKIQHAHCRKAGNFGTSIYADWDTDISDSEAYMSGDYF